MNKIRTEENAMLDNKFRHLFYGSLEIGQLIINKKNYYVVMLGKEFLYPTYKKNTLQEDIERDYIKIVRELALITGESRFNSDGIDLSTIKKLDVPTGFYLKNKKK